MAKIKSACIKDYSGFEAGLSSNGGSYGFWTIYRYIGNGKYTVEHGTTADFDYCEFCGSFGSCNCEGYTIVKEEFVLQEIKNAENYPSPDITVSFKVFDDQEKWLVELKSKIAKRIEETKDDEDIIKCAIYLNIDI